MKIEVGKKYVAGGVQFVALAPIPGKEAGQVIAKMIKGEEE